MKYNQQYMTKNPFINALTATIYIALVATFMFYGPRFADTKDTLLVPIAMISLLTFSAATMSFLFFYRPIQMYLDGNKKDATHFFLKTLGSFGVITALVFASIFLNTFLKIV